MAKPIVNRAVLSLYDEYDGDFELLYERWAPQIDRDKFTVEQLTVLSSYVDQLNFLGVHNLSASLAARTRTRVLELEEFIAPDVVANVRKRLGAPGVDS